ncbi:MAG: hypothetical protein OXN89_07290 [Bryobacterales bacterium]|nr:hypothetical protein [Bryobacterales bacterium]
MQREREGRSGGNSVKSTAMTDDAVQKAALSGGDKTRERLDFLKCYLNDYTTALEWIPIGLDRTGAFASAGEALVPTPGQDHEQLVGGTLRGCWICEEDG